MILFNIEDDIYKSRQYFLNYLFDSADLSGADPETTFKGANLFKRIKI